MTDLKARIKAKLTDKSFWIRLLIEALILTALAAVIWRVVPPSRHAQARQELANISRLRHHYQNVDRIIITYGDDVLPFSLLHTPEVFSTALELVNPFTGPVHGNMTIDWDLHLRDELVNIDYYIGRRRLFSVTVFALAAGRTINDRAINELIFDFDGYRALAIIDRGIIAGGFEGGVLDIDAILALR